MNKIPTRPGTNLSHLSHYYFIDFAVVTVVSVVVLASIVKFARGIWFA